MQYSIHIPKNVRAEDGAEQYQFDSTEDELAVARGFIEAHKSFSLPKGAVRAVYDKLMAGEYGELRR